MLIAALCAAPIVLGSAAYYYGWGTGKRSNYGELLAPRRLSAPALATLHGKWVLVTFDAAACDAYCERKLYLIRQIRRGQGAGEVRIERLWFLTDGGTVRPELLSAIEGTHIARANEALLAAFPGRAVDHVYLVDPLGNLMMRFPRDPDPSAMAKDLERLLKYSRFG
jgi:hypothetical protein